MKKFFIVVSVALGIIFCGNIEGIERGVGIEKSVGYVNFKVCAEKSKQGQNEKTALEALEKQMSDALEKTDSELKEIAKKLDDRDYMDGLSPTAEEELKQKFQALSQDYACYQNQFFQLLKQANYKMFQTLHDEVSLASEKLREQKKLVFIFNEDSVFAYLPSLDYTQEVIDLMDKQYDKENSAAVAQE